MHLIGRKSDSSARASSFREAKQGGLTNVANNMLACPYLLDRSAECFRDRLLDQTLAQSDAQISSENLDDYTDLRAQTILRIDFAAARPWRSGRVHGGDFSNKSSDSRMVNGCGVVLPSRDFERGFRGIPVSTRRAMKLRVADFGGRCSARKITASRSAGVRGSFWANALPVK